MWRREMETVSFESAGTSKSLVGGATTKASPTDSMELHKATLNNVCTELMNPRTACPLPDCQEDYTTREVDETEPKLHVQQKILGRLQPDWVELEASIPSDRCTYVYVDGENLFATALTKCKNIHGYRDLFDILASFATRLIYHMIADDGPNRLALQRPPIRPTVDSTTFYVVYVKWPGSPMVRQLYESASGQGVLIGVIGVPSRAGGRCCEAPDVCTHKCFCYLRRRLQVGRGGVYLLHTTSKTATLLVQS